MLKVFVSFAEQDAKVVARLESEASARGDIKFYRFDRDKRPGVSVAAKIKQAIKDADVVAVLLTKHSAGSDWIRHETGAAHALDKRIIPIAVPGAHVPPLLDGVERLTLDPADPAGSITRTADYLKTLETEKARQEIGLLMGAALLAFVFTRK